MCVSLSLCVYVRVPVGVLFSLIFGLLWVSPLIEQPMVPGDPVAVFVFAMAALLELTAEPLWVMSQLNQYVSLKVGGHVISVCVCMYVM